MADTSRGARRSASPMAMAAASIRPREGYSASGRSVQEGVPLLDPEARVSGLASPELEQYEAWKRSYLSRYPEDSNDPMLFRSWMNNQYGRDLRPTERLGAFSREPRRAPEDAVSTLPRPSPPAPGQPMRNVGRARGSAPPPRLPRDLY